MTKALTSQRMEAVWRERADRLSQRSVVAGVGEDALPVVVLGIEGERYGINLSDVSEVLPPVRPTPVPGAPPVFAGVINVHGEIRPVIDLRSLLGVETVPDNEPARVIMLCRAGREMGLRIDCVERISWIGPEDLLPPGSSIAGSRHIERSTKDLLMILSTEALFAELDTGVST